jgi:hypothetical protein
MKATRILVISAFIISLLGAAYAWFVLLDLRESVYCQRGSWDFWVGITEPVIKSFPAPSAASSEYHWGCGDGPKPPDQTIAFKSSLPVAEVLTLAQRHIVSYGFHPLADLESSGLSFTNGQGWLYVAAKATDDGGTHFEASFSPR